MNIVILEGVDGAGKTTLAAQLAQRYDADTTPVGPPRKPRTALAELVELIAERSMDRLTIFDRFHFGNLAYGEVFRGGNDLLAEEWIALEKLLRTTGCLVVLCTPPLATIKTVMEARRMGGTLDPRGFEDDWFSTTTIHRLMLHAYDRSRLPKMMYDYSATRAFDGLVGVLEHHMVLQQRVAV